MELFFLLVITLVLSGIFSGSEIAFLVANRLKIEVRARQKVMGASTALWFSKKPEKFFTTMLVGNNIANVAASSIATALFGLMLGWSEFEILILVSVLILVFGEIVPKTVARDSADLIITLVAIIIRVVRFILYPLVYLSEKTTQIILRLFNVSVGDVSYFVSRSDIYDLAQESKEYGDVDSEDGTLLVKAISLADIPVKEAMIPRTEIIAVEQSAALSEVVRTFRRSGFSRLPVYKDTLDNIVGVVYARDLFQRPKSLKSITRDILFVPDAKKCTDLLREFRQKGVTIAIVVDEFGGTAGLVTTEDLIEELVGEIHDEFDTEEIVCQKVDDYKFLVSGRVEVDFLNERYQLSIPEGEYETVAGLVLQHIGRIPRENEEFTVHSIRFKIKKSTPTKIHLLELEFPAGIDDESQKRDQKD